MASSSHTFSLIGLFMMQLVRFRFIIKRYLIIITTSLKYGRHKNVGEGETM